MALFYTMLGDPMNRSVPRLHAHGARLATLLGTASFLTMANVIADRDRAYAGEVEVAQAPEEIPENVLITGSLIRGTTAVGVPVVNLSPMDFAQTGALTTADLFKNFPAAIIMDGETGQIAAARVDRGEKVNLRGLDPTNATRGLLMVDGLRVPASGNGLCAIDPSLPGSIPRRTGRRRCSDLLRRDRRKQCGDSRSGLRWHCRSRNRTGCQP